MTSPLPTLVFLAGAFADPSCFDALTSELQKAGYPTVYTTVLTLNPSNPQDVSTSQDAEHVRNKFFLPLLDEGKDIVVIAHSYGGVVGGAAAAGLSKIERLAQGKSSGILGLLYIVGNIVGDGQSLLQAIGGTYPPFIVENHVSLHQETRLTALMSQQSRPGVAVINPVMETLYNDVDASRSAEG
jgi:pimeloyl-ACP methyl ester carboxylesterase